MNHRKLYIIRQARALQLTPKEFESNYDIRQGDNDTFTHSLKREIIERQRERAAREEYEFWEIHARYHGM